MKRLTVLAVLLLTVYVLGSFSALANWVLPEEDSKEDIDSIRTQLEQLRRRNEDAVAWLQIPGTAISTPVMYRPEETNGNNFYLHRDLDGKYSFAGVPFADYRCRFGEGTVAGLGRSTVIYVNNTLGTSDGNGMNDLQRYFEEDFAKKNKEVNFVLYGQAATGQIVAVSPVTTDMPYNNPTMTDAELDETIAKLTEVSLFDYGVQVGAKDKLLLISTPYYIPASETPGVDRLVLLVKLTPVVESRLDLSGIY